jgi:hypothetical protein
LQVAVVKEDLMRFTRTLLTLGVTGALVIATAQGASAASVTVAKWNMDDTGTTMTDSSGHGHNGTLHNVRTGQPGVSGKAFQFASHPAYVSVPSATDLNPVTASFTITLHVRFPARPSSSVGDFDVLRKGLSTTDGGSYKIEILQSGKAFCDFRGSTHEGSLTGTKALAVNAWHTIVCTRTATSMKLTVDGVATSKTVTTGTISNTGNLYVGAKNASGGDQFTGLVDAVTIQKG